MRGPEGRICEPGLNCTDWVSSEIGHCRKENERGKRGKIGRGSRCEGRTHCVPDKAGKKLK